MSSEATGEPGAVLDRLPVGVLHLSPDGTILDANAAALRLVGVAASDVVGRNIVEFSTAEAARSSGLLAFGTENPDVAMGPVKIRYRHVDGSVRHGDLWAQNLLADPDVEAIVVVITPESTAPHISAALSSVAAGGAVDATLEVLAESLRASPFSAAGCWLVQDDVGRRLVGGEHISEPVQVALKTPGPWWRALDGGAVTQVADVAAETDDHHRLLAAAGVSAWWLHPLPRALTGAGRAGVVVTRRTAGVMSPNQAEQLGHIVTAAGLAFERTAMQERLSHAAFHDSLTGLANRERFFDRSGGGSHPDAALLYVDLDDFKRVNDRHGHSAGDLVLVTVADRLRGAVRPGDRITRMGGDEFVVECVGLVDELEAVGVAQRIIEALQRPVVLDDASLEIGASVGIAMCTAGASIDSLLERSDAALYAAKAAGRGRWHLAATDDSVGAAGR